MNFVSFRLWLSGCGGDMVLKDGKRYCGGSTQRSSEGLTMLSRLFMGLTFSTLDGEVLLALPPGFQRTPILDNGMRHIVYPFSRKRAI